MVGVRTFVSIALAPEAAGEAGRLQDVLARLQPDGVRWTRGEQMHFTLAFLGEVPEDALSRVTGAARRAAAAQGQFELSLGGGAVFPPRGAPRVLWLGAAAGGRELVRLQARLTVELSTEGFTAEARDFVPHVTLGRVLPGVRLSSECLAALAAAAPAARQTAAALEVMRSDLRPEGARHTRVAECPLLGREG